MNRVSRHADAIPPANLLLYGRAWPSARAIYFRLRSLDLAVEMGAFLAYAISSHGYSVLGR